MEYLKAEAKTKVAYKVEIRIAKNYLLKTLQKERAFLLFSSSHVALDKKERCQEKRQISERPSFIGASLLFHCSVSGIPGASEPPEMSQRGRQCGCGSPHRA